MKWPNLFGWTSFNDRLALFLLIVIPLIWVADGYGPADFTLSPEVAGALIVTWTSVIAFYFRKKPPPNSGKPSGG